MLCTMQSTGQIQIPFQNVTVPYPGEGMNQNAFVLKVSGGSDSGSTPRIVSPRLSLVTGILFGYFHHPKGTLSRHSLHGVSSVSMIGKVHLF